MRNINYNQAFDKISSIDCLVRVFENYGNTVTKKYNSYETRCEFHNDKNPSMGIFSNNGVGLYKCWGCGEKGNIVTYVKNKENCNAFEALEVIYDILGMDITPYVTETNEFEGMTKEERLEAIKRKEEELKLQEAKIKERNKHLALLHSHKDKALLNSNVEVQDKAEELIQEIHNGSEDYHKVEFINHAMFTPNLVIEIDKYISEDMSGLIMALQEAQAGKRVLFISPTGSGKNYTTINFLKSSYGFKTVLVGPNASNIQQTMTSYDVPGAYGDLSAVDAFTQDCNVKTFTWDKMIKLKDLRLSEYVLLLDEADQMFRDLYRGKAIKGFNAVAPQFKGRMDMTGTPTKLDFKEFDYIVEYKQKKQTDYKVKIYDGINKEEMLKIMKNAKAFGILYDNINTLDIMKEKLSDKKTDIITSDRKSTSELYKLIMENSSMGAFEGCLNTSAMIAGVNINNEKMTDIIVAGIMDIGTIKQYVARYRGLEKVNVHIFNDYKQEDGAIYSIEDAIKRDIKRVEEEVERMNIELHTDEFGDMQDAFSIAPLQSDGEKIYKDEELGVYKANISSIRGMKYNAYYRTRSARQHRELLLEQFNNIQVEIEVVGKDEDFEKEINELKKDRKEAYNIAMDTLVAYKNKLVGYAELMIENRESDELSNYFKYRRIKTENRVKELEGMKLNEFFKLKKVREQNKIFTKYVVEYNYPVDFAWELSLKGKNYRANFFRNMNMIAYRYFLEELPHAINENAQEIKMYKFIDDKVEFSEYYTKEGISELAKEFNEKFYSFGYRERDLSVILKTMYNIKEVKMDGEKLDELSEEQFLYGKKAEKKHAGKRVGMMKINSYKTINDLKNDLKEELALPSSSNVVEIFINNKVKQYFNTMSEEFKKACNLNIEEFLLPVALDNKNNK